MANLQNVSVEHQTAIANLMAKLYRQVASASRQFAVQYTHTPVYVPAFINGSTSNANSLGADRYLQSCMQSRSQVTAESVKKLSGCLIAS